MALRALKFASLTAAASGIYLYGNKFLDPNDFGVVRVGRAIATVSSNIAMCRKIPRWIRELEFTRTWDFLHSLSAFSAGLGNQNVCRELFMFLIPWGERRWKHVRNTSVVSLFWKEKNGDTESCVCFPG